MERGCCFSPKWVAEFGGIFFLSKKWKTILLCPYCHNPIFNHFILIIIIILFTKKDKKNDDDKKIIMIKNK
jgi:dolichyl-phosphate-mannose--protein O-mannosyl transferase